MPSTALTITFNGEYSFKDKTITKDSSYDITEVNGKIFFDGILYDEFEFIPVNESTTVRIKSGSNGEWIRKYTSAQLNDLLKERSTFSKFTSSDTFIKIDFSTLAKYTSL